MLSSLPDFQKERRFPCTPSRKKNLLKFKRESTRSGAHPKTVARTARCFSAMGNPGDYHFSSSQLADGLVALTLFRP